MGVQRPRTPVASIPIGSYLCYLKKRAEPARARIYLGGLGAVVCIGHPFKETAVVLPLIIFACEVLWSGRTAPSWWGTWTMRSLDALPRRGPLPRAGS